MTVLAGHEPDRLKENTSRQSGFEILRLLAMVFVVGNHFGAHSGFEFLPSDASANRLWIEFFEFLGYNSVNIFVLLTGYFRIQSRGFKTAKLIQFWLQLFFYSMGIYLVFVLAGWMPLSFGGIIRHALPVASGRWWFASTYFVLTLLSPFLNMLLKAFSRKQFLVFLAVTGFCWCVMPTLTGTVFEGNYLLWFIFVYSLAAYLRLYGIRTRLSAGKLIALAASCFVLAYLIIVLIDTLGAGHGPFGEMRYYFFSFQRFPMPFLSFFLFLGFSKLRIKPRPFLNAVSSASFAVYLVSEHTSVRYPMWLDLFRNREYIGDPLLILRCLGEIAAIFIISILIELARTCLLERNYMPLVRRLAKSADRRIESFEGEKKP
ncbi:MAG: acyltransferase [Clostridia bacterium]|nr:acyltransferase [Clostridia bacterium]